MIEFCDVCQKKRKADSWRSMWDSGKIVHLCERHFKTTTSEHVPESMKEDRRQNAKSMIQPWREGEASAEFIKAYPERAKKMFTLKERMKAKEVWKEDLPSGWEKSR